jgi:hypothetical protein
MSTRSFLLSVSVLAGVFVGTVAGQSCPTLASGFAGGSGTQSDPWLVCNATQLSNVRLHMNPGIWFRQIADVDLTGQSFAVIGQAPVGGAPQFFANYDGNGYRILNLNIDTAAADTVGLFGKLGNTAVVSNLGLEGILVHGALCVGCIAAENNGSIVNCYAKGAAIGSGFVGGLVGDNRASIVDSYAEVDVSGSSSLGGIVGVHFGVNSTPPAVVRTFASGHVAASGTSGGLVGSDFVHNAIVTDSFWDVQTSGQSASVGGTGKTTAQMKMLATYPATWDFATVWRIDDGVDYPRLRWERGQVGVTWCSGDGSGSACPCGNSAPSGSGTGCMTSLGNGGLLQASGNVQISADTVRLTATGLPDSAALFFQGMTQANGGLGAPFGDGLRCASGTIVRLATRTAVAGTAIFPGPGDRSLMIKGQMPPCGGPRTYQVWFRNAAAFCTPSTFNLTNGLELTWIP